MILRDADWWRQRMREAMSTPVDWEVIWGHPLPDGYEDWEDFMRHGPKPERQAEQLLTGQEP